MRPALRSAFTTAALAAATAVAARRAPAQAPAQGPAQPPVVVVHAAGPASLSRDDVGRAFLKRGGALLPVDQRKSARVRDAFSRAFLGRPASAVAVHWQEQIFAGREVPPPERGSDAEVLAFVRANPRAIGYVSAGADLGPGVKAVAVR
jgi:hypothetical protein